MKTAIQDKGFTQKELSEILRVNQDTITNYVKEKSFPKADMLLNICDLLDISIDWLIKDDEHHNQNDIESLIPLISKLNRYEIVYVKKYIQFLIWFRNEETAKNSVQSEKSEIRKE